MEPTFPNLKRYRALKKIIDHLTERIEFLKEELYGPKPDREEGVFIMPPSSSRDAYIKEMQDLEVKRKGYRNERSDIKEQAKKEQEQEKRIHLAKNRARRRQYEKDRLSGKAFIKRFNGPAKFKASQSKKGKIKSESIKTEHSVRTISAGTGNW